MTVRICNVTFSDWISLPLEGGWSDTLIFQISVHACVPPFHYGTLLKRLARNSLPNRPGASIWVQVDGPGEWFAAEVRNSLRDMDMPFVVSGRKDPPRYLDFSSRPKLYERPPQSPAPVEIDWMTLEEPDLRCLQCIARMKKGTEDDIVSLTGLSQQSTGLALARLQERKLIEYKVSPKIVKDKTARMVLDPFPLWHLTSRGRHLALRAWHVPPGIAFRGRVELLPWQIALPHRRIARAWPLWLKAAWPNAEIWSGWSEVGLPLLHVIPDGLAWGRIHGYETLFWLEVGDDHKKTRQILQSTVKRLDGARELQARTGVRLVYAQLSLPWVLKLVRRCAVNLPPDMAMVTGSHHRFGRLSQVEWGCFTQL